jgi:hypothetical protein
MSQSNSKLLNYISLLLADDAALERYLIDPITEAEGEHGLTKAERSVLRRTLSHLSNKALHGFSLKRELGSYRRSLRLLQNVLDNVGSKMVQDEAAARNAQPGLNTQGYYYFVVNVYYPAVTTSTDFTCKDNSYVQGFGGPYANQTAFFVAKLPIFRPTIQQVMDEVNLSYGNPIPYDTVLNGGVVSSFTLGGNTISADLSNSCYDLKRNPSADSVFWFWSINGRANGKNSRGTVSFATETLNPGDTVFWQLIAPDSTYGFLPCT